MNGVSSVIEKDRLSVTLGGLESSIRDSNFVTTLISDNSIFKAKIQIIGVGPVVSDRREKGEREHGQQ